MKLSFQALLPVFLLLLVLRTDAGVPGAPDLRKLHPALQSLVRQRASIFHGLPVFDAVAPGAALSEVIVYTRDPAALRAAGISVQSVCEHFVTALVRTPDLKRLAVLSQVEWVDPGSLHKIQTDVSIPETGARLVQGSFLNSTPYTGRGAIVVIYDTGIDWKHMDFRDPADPSKSRILAIWDQTLTPSGTETNPSGFGYGVEYTKAQIDAELGSSPPGFVREADSNGHGTHVAGIAVGNGLSFGGKYTGMAPGADIVVVKGGNGTFSEARMVDGLQYATNTGVRFGKPVAFNFSIVSQEGAHDGTSADEVALDNFVSVPGRAAVASAGNDGDSFVHQGGTVPPGGSDTIRIVVPPYAPTPGPDNDSFFIDVWLEDFGSVDAKVVSPTGKAYTALADQTGGTSPDTGDGTTELFVYTSPANTHINAWLYVHDAPGTPVPASGTWLLILSNRSAGNSQVYDSWLPLRTVGANTVSAAGADNDKSITMPATSRGVISAGAYVTKWDWPSYDGSQYTYDITTNRTSDIASFSSHGPTADGRQKPDLAAPGQGIVAAMSSTADTMGEAPIMYAGKKHWVLQGTSMAAPHVTGACALLLGSSPSLSAPEIKQLLQAGAHPDPFTASVPNSIWGYGKLDILEAMARHLSSGAQVVRTTMAYDSAGLNSFVTLTGPAKVAMRFTAPSAGQATGVLVNTTTARNDPIVGTGSLLCEIDAMNGSTPGTRLGSSVSMPIALLNPGTMNYVQIGGAVPALDAGTDYVVVLSLSNPTDLVKLRTDQARTGSRSSVYDGTTWGPVAFNFRTRVIVTSATGTNGVSEGTSHPLTFALEQNYPNPFNPSTRISYTIPWKGMVHLTVFDILGKEIVVLVKGEQAPGSHQVEWKGTNTTGMPVASGVYFYRLESAGLTKTSKMMLLR